MKELDIKLGYACNNNCLFCLNKDKRSFFHTTENLKKHIKSSALKGCKKLIVSGGEPLIYNNFFEILLYAKECKIPLCEIQTNGRALFYENYVKEIQTIYPNISFLVSFHYPTNKMYQQYSQSNGFFQVLKGLENLNKFNLKFTINIVLFKGNIYYLKEILKTLDEAKCKNIQFRFIDGGNVLEQFYDFVPRMKDAVKQVKECIEDYSDKSIYIHEIPFCVLGKKMIKYSSPETNKNRENLNANKIILNSPEIMEQQFVFPNCDNCIHREQCKGVRKTYFNMYGSNEINPIINKN
ncbi:MAG: radical SAM protein [Candidatus Paceibacterota bacterium]